MAQMPWFQKCLIIHSITTLLFLITTDDNKMLMYQAEATLFEGLSITLVFIKMKANFS